MAWLGMARFPDVELPYGRTLNMREAVPDGSVGAAIHVVGCDARPAFPVARRNRGAPTALIDRLKVDKVLRRPCGDERVGLIPERVDVFTGVRGIRGQCLASPGPRVADRKDLWRPKASRKSSKSPLFIAISPLVRNRNIPECAFF